MIRNRKFRSFILKGILVLLFLTVPMPVSALDYLPEGCFGQLTEDQVVVYYFTRKFRCQSCETLENTMLETVRKHYPASYSSGKLAMCVINVDDPVNRHYLDEFDILSSSVYIVDKRCGLIFRSMKLEEVWEVVDDAQAISRLLMKSLGEYLGESGQVSESEIRETGGSDGKSADAGGKSDGARQDTKPSNRVRNPVGKSPGPGN